MVKDFIAVAAALSLVSAGPLPPARLRADGSNLQRQSNGKPAPSTDFAIAGTAPVFTWAPGHTDRGESQSMYEVEVRGYSPHATEFSAMPPHWRSGAVQSSAPSTAYAGTAK